MTKEITAGARFRGAYEEQYEPDGLGDQALIDRVCALLDRIEHHEARIEADGSLVTGSTGQQVAHPLLAVVRADETLLAKLLKELRLSLDPKPENIHSTRARAAAEARWARR